MGIRAVEKEYSHQELEKKILEYWGNIDLVHKIGFERRNSPKFYFLDGPPYMNNPPHLGHARTRAIRDSVLKYRVMRGYNVRLQPGFDMHGLPIEVRVEEMINSKSKRDIEKFGVERFIETCKRCAYEYQDRWTTFYQKFGLHMDIENPYLTLNNDYIEASWFFFKKAKEKNLLYRGKGTVAWCPRCETPLSGYEATDEYLDVSDPSIYIKFPLGNSGRESLLVWTTTPWTLPGNVAIAINPKFEYVKLGVGEEVWIVAQPAIPRLGEELPQLSDGKVLEVFPGSKLLGLRYHHPLTPKIPAHKKLAEKNPNLHTVVAADFVSAEEGTGCVHIAPGHGPEDYTLGLKENLPIFSPVDERGVFTDEAGDYKGLYVKNADPLIIRDLEEYNSLVYEGRIRHRYPHCWRCKSPLIYRASDQWFISIDPIKDQMLKANREILWVPPWAGSKRFHDWIVNARDWCISRQRYWGIPLPIWMCTNNSCSHWVVLSSLEEIKEKTRRLPLGEVDLHKPWLDRVVLTCPKCGSDMKRVPDVADVWFDSGASSWASLGYPKRKDEFEKWFPVDFITEGLDQTRGWFYTLLVEGIIAFDQTPYRTVLMNEFVLDERGERMSKSLGNVVDPLEIMDQFGADTTRFYLVSEAAAWDKIKVSRKSLENTGRMINILWNVYKFTTIYMSLDRYTPQSPGGEGLRLEDRWILSKVNTLVGDVTEAFEKLYLHQAARALREFIV
ncbi:MAG: isoleucine--tRNA ligase [Methanobacteriota archaeon]|nr:MAG: isoleucine--tRNA ligase [Euryarchaeota archaeon]